MNKSLNPKLRQKSFFILVNLLLGGIYIADILISLKVRFLAKKELMLHNSGYLMAKCKWILQFCRVNQALLFSLSSNFLAMLPKKNQKWFTALPKPKQTEEQIYKVLLVLILTRDVCVHRREKRMWISQPCRFGSACGKRVFLKTKQSVNFFNAFCLLATSSYDFILSSIGPSSICCCGKHRRGENG